MYQRDYNTSIHAVSAAIILQNAQSPVLFALHVPGVVLTESVIAVAQCREFTYLHHTHTNACFRPRTFKEASHTKSLAPSESARDFCALLQERRFLARFSKPTRVYFCTPIALRGAQSYIAS